jgi:hydrogenase nickel incorporation protein HypA/HybF
VRAVHEVSIMAGIFEIISDNVDEHKLKKVNRVVLQIGEFTCVEESALRFAFEAYSKDTEAEEAELVINRVKATAKCDNCGRVFDIAFTNKICDHCGTFSSNIVSGYELLLSEIEGD